MTSKTTEAQEPSRFKLVEHFVGRERRYSKALELACSYLSDEQAEEIADAMPPPEELAEPVKQEPVAWMMILPDGTHDWIIDGRDCDGYVPLYTTQPSVEAVAGSDDDTDKAAELVWHMQAQLEAMRIETLEKAAQKCEEIVIENGGKTARNKTSFECAAAIRGMK